MVAHDDALAYSASLRSKGKLELAKSEALVYGRQATESVISE